MKRCPLSGVRCPEIELAKKVTHLGAGAGSGERQHTTQGSHPTANTQSSARGDCGAGGAAPIEARTHWRRFPELAPAPGPRRSCQDETRTPCPDFGFFPVVGSRLPFTGIGAAVGGSGSEDSRKPGTGHRLNPRTPDNGHRLERGFSLLELLVATTLLSVGLLGIARVAISVINGNLTSEQMTTATVLAQDAVEELKSPAAISNTDSNVTEDYGTISGYPVFKRVRNVEANSPVPGLQRITVTVFWQADSRSLSLQTIR